jgi:hypothetical protein
VKYSEGIHKTSYTFRRVSQYCILCSICVCVTNLCHRICTYLFTHVAICHWHYSHHIKASTVETVSILEMAYNFWAGYRNLFCWNIKFGANGNNKLQVKLPKVGFSGHKTFLMWPLAQSFLNVLPFLRWICVEVTKFHVRCWHGVEVARWYNMKHYTRACTRTTTKHFLSISKTFTATKAMNVYTTHEML